MEIRFEYPWKRYFIKVETADDKNNWVAVADYTVEGIEGSPVHIPISKVCKSVKISFLNKPGAAKPSGGSCSFTKLFIAMRLRKIWLLCNLVCIIPGAFAQQFIHPGVLHSEKSLERIKRLVDQKAQRLMVRMKFSQSYRKPGPTIR